MTTTEARTAALAAAVWTALATVRDPELDEPLTDLGFVAAYTVSETGEARVRLRLPTYFCAPNFAYLMVADADDAVRRVPGVTGVDVRLDDHFAAAAINRGVAARAGFVASFDGQAANELDDLRADFLRKAVLAGTDRICRGLDRDRLAELTLGDASAGPDRERLRDRRRELGLPCADSDPLVIDATTGEPIAGEHMRRHLCLARTTRVSQEANSAVCAGMLRVRYAATEEEKAR